MIMLIGIFRTALGIEFRESTIAITSKCNVRAKKGKENFRWSIWNWFYRIVGMTFQVSIGFSGLENADGKDDQSKIYALFIGDTVLVNEVKKKQKKLKNLFKTDYIL